MRSCRCKAERTVLHGWSGSTFDNASTPLHSLRSTKMVLFGQTYRASNTPNTSSLSAILISSFSMSKLFGVGRLASS